MDRTRRILWLVLMVVLPVPYWVMESGHVPTIWLIELSGFSLAMLFSEGGTVTQLVTALFAAQAVLSAGVLYVVARLAARLLHGALPARWQTTGVVLAVFLLLGSALLRQYATPLVAGGGSVNLIELFA